MDRLQRLLPAVLETSLIIGKCLLLLVAALAVAQWMVLKTEGAFSDEECERSTVNTVLCGLLGNEE